MRPLSLLLLPALSAAAFAQDPIDPAAVRFQSISDAYTRFLEDHGRAWKAEWNVATATPKALYGTGIRLQDGRIEDLATARRHATRVLAEQHELLGFGASQFIADIEAETDNVFVLVHRQRFRGLEVVGGRADLRISKAGVLAMLGSSAVPVPAGFSVQPRIGIGQAWAVAHAHLEVTATPREGLVAVRPQADLVIHADVDALAPAMPRLAWRVQIDERGGAEPVVAQVYVDALTGAVLQEVDQVYRCAAGHLHVRGVRETACAAPPVALTGNVLAWTNVGASPLDPLSNVPMQGLQVTAAGVGTAFTDANGDFSIPYTGTAPVTLTVSLGNGAGEHLGGGIQPQQGTLVSTSVQATPGTPVQIQLLTQTSGNFDWSQTAVLWHVDDANRWLRSLVGDTPQMNQLSRMSATVNRPSSCNAFYTGNTINFYAAGGGCNMTGFSSVIYHEWGHGLDDVFGGINNTIDGLSEAWGDIVATYRMDDPIVGKDFTTSGGIVRTALNTRRYPAGGFPSGGAPHPKGEVFMGWAWNVRSQLIAALGQAAGTARAEAIVVASLAADAKNQPDAVREVFLLDDDDGNLANGTPNYDLLEAACQTRDLPYPEIRLVDIQHTALTTYDRPLEPREVRADLAAVTGSFSTAELVYGTIVPTSRRPLVPTGNGAEHVALLPGISGNQSMRYAIEVQHSSGRVQRLPQSGFFDYRVGRLTTVFSEDFEGSSTGWTSAGAANEWQIGVPQGRSGSSIGIAWSDPSQAFDGTRCAGTDLGIPGNGSYQWFSNQTLTSPLIDLSGTSAPMLRFARQVSVGLLDTATVSVNGTALEALSGGVTETSWSTVEYDLAGFSGQQIRLEFNLGSTLPFQLGGWNVDAVEITSFASVPAPAVELRVTPEQLAPGATAQIAVQGAANGAALLLISPNRGPLSIPGFPELGVGQPLDAVALALDGSGAFGVSFNAPNDPSIAGALTYAQVLQLAGGQLDVSNVTVLLGSL